MRPRKRRYKTLTGLRCATPGAHQALCHPGSLALYVDLLGPVSALSHRITVAAAGRCTPAERERRQSLAKEAAAVALARRVGQVTGPVRVGRPELAKRLVSLTEEECIQLVQFALEVPCTSTRQ